MADTEDPLSRAVIDAVLADLPDWRYQLDGLVTVFKTSTAADALALIAAVGQIAEEQNHHPDLDWRYNRVFLRYTSHDAGTQVTDRDVAAASAASEVAAVVGAVAEPGLYRSVELAIDTDDAPAISETWRVGLGYRKTADGALVDPYGRGPALWFQETDEPHENRMHVDVYRSLAESGPVLTKTESTGALMEHDHAPAWVVVTDSQGNRFCLCTEAEDGQD
ncbi:4a-hydroxytetrahydrobiopterin dehydratase [Paenarthrobacter sp. NPDC092416]|uniref:4a-hydroxytetrahydrobiopterin dehydratase n=1 Tax=Paenarthrobacter sp. NPDC092416 TaxID=3364386 RepID=UPI003806547E